MCLAPPITQSKQNGRNAAKEKTLSNDNLTSAWFCSWHHGQSANDQSTQRQVVSVWRGRAMFVLGLALTQQTQNLASCL